MALKIERTVAPSLQTMVPRRVWSSDSLLRAPRQLRLHVATLSMSSLSRRDKIFTRQSLFRESKEARGVGVPLTHSTVWRGLLLGFSSPSNEAFRFSIITAGVVGLFGGYSVGVAFRTAATLACGQKGAQCVELAFLPKFRERVEGEARETPPPPPSHSHCADALLRKGHPEQSRHPSPLPCLGLAALPRCCCWCLLACAPAPEPATPRWLAEAPCFLSLLQAPSCHSIVWGLRAPAFEQACSSRPAGAGLMRACPCRQRAPLLSG